MPLISYINSAYNSSEFLPGLLDDLLNKQSLKDIEVIIVDSKSTDNTLEIAREWQSKDARVIVVEQARRTPYGVSWLDGWKNAGGEVVGNSNSDDRSFPWRGQVVYDEAMTASIRSDSPHSFYYGGYETRINGLATAVGIPQQFSINDFSQFFRAGVHVHWNNNIYKIVDWDKMYSAAWKYKSAFDYWLTLYFISKGVIGRVIPKVISIYNQRTNSLEQSNKLRSTFESLASIEEFFPESPAIKGLYSNPNKDFVGKYLDYKAALLGGEDYFDVKH